MLLIITSSLNLFVRFQKPTIACGDKMHSFLGVYCPIFSEKFWPTVWCIEARAQTIICSVFAKRPDVPYERYVSSLSLWDQDNLRFTWEQFQVCLCCSLLFFSGPRSEGWPHHGHTFSIYLCPLSFWFDSSMGSPVHVCCPSRRCVVFLAFVHLALFLALSLSPGYSLVSSWCDHRILASLLLTVCLFHLC